MADVFLEFRRDIQTGLCNGRIWVDGEVVPSEVFDGEGFREMLTRYAAWLQTYTAHRAIFLRTDRPGLQPYVLDEKVVHLFRTDPVAAISSMCPPDPPSVLLDLRKKAEAKKTATALRAGYDTLANSFGETIYAKRRPTDGRVECPVCGIWSRVVEVELQKYVECHNQGCLLHNICTPFQAKGNWAGFSVEELLRTGASRFFFPREWNDGQSWVSRFDLESRLSKFKEEVT